MNRQNLAIALFLLAATAAIYAPTGHFPYVSLDDGIYTYENDRVAQGLTADGAAWALTTFRTGNWHPATWLSLMLDVSLFGMSPGAHHLVNAGFHAANAILLFLLLARATGAPWRSAFAAALFAVHPLRVESVAWAAERKDVLCGFFFLLTMLAYVRYAERPGRRRYAAFAIPFLLALASKAMAVTLPFVLLLMDWWPLGRLGRATEPGTSRLKAVGRILLEKAPLLVPSAAACVLTIMAQAAGEGISELPLKFRLSNAVTSYAGYLGKAFCPHSLSVFYPHPMEFATELPVRQVAAAALLLLAVTAVALHQARRRPFLAFGWLFFLGTLVPVIGVVQVGLQRMADRYGYLPLVGIFVAVAWAIPDPGRRAWRALAGAACGAAVLALAALSTIQVGYWKSDVDLFGHAVAVDPGNTFARYLLGKAYVRAGRPMEAVAQFRQVVDSPTGIHSQHAGRALTQLGFTYTLAGLHEMAERTFREALALGLDNPIPNRVGLAEALANRGKFDEAAATLREALRLDPGNARVADLLRRVEAAVPGAVSGTTP